MKPKTDKIEIRLVPPELHKTIKDLAHRQGISMNKWLLAALEKAAKEQDDAAKIPRSGKKGKGLT